MCMVIDAGTMADMTSSRKADLTYIFQPIAVENLRVVFSLQLGILFLNWPVRFIYSMQICKLFHNTTN